MRTRGRLQVHARAARRSCCSSRAQASGASPCRAPRSTLRAAPPAGHAALQAAPPWAMASRRPRRRRSALPSRRSKTTGNKYTDHFLALWTDIHKLSNGYFSPEGVPYHAVETLIVEAPDQGHETTSEAYSYWVWLESAYGRLTKDWSFLGRAWQSLEYYLVPRPAEQPTNGSYSASKPATYAEEGDLPCQYPKPLEAVGRHRAGPDLRRAQGRLRTAQRLRDALARGRRQLVRLRPSRRRDEPRRADQHLPARAAGVGVGDGDPADLGHVQDWGGPNGYLDIFQKAGSFARQWKYTAAPPTPTPAPCRRSTGPRLWADEQGGSAERRRQVAKKAAKLGDFARYSLFDSKYFKKIGLHDSRACPRRTSDYGSWRTT